MCWSSGWSRFSWYAAAKWASARVRQCRSYAIMLPAPRSRAAFGCRSMYRTPFSSGMVQGKAGIWGPGGKSSRYALLQCTTRHPMPYRTDRCLMLSK
ncbi:hypothetical protein DMH15_27845 [Streptomyces sp. WAC 06725]|nr:hypothetical protein DMH15_27845 [Streptomyces sp. WAC 06725]